LEPKEWAKLTWRWWWLIVLTAVLAGTAGFMASRLMLPTYTASSTFLITPAPAAGGSLDVNTLRTSEGLAKTYVLLLRTRPVLEDVIANLKLGTDYRQLAKQVSVTPIRDTQLIVLTVEDSNPQRAADVANEIARVFGRENRRLQASRYEMVVVEAAQVEAEPASPKIWLNTLLSAAVGVMLAIGWVLLVGHLGPAAKSSAEMVALRDRGAGLDHAV